MAQIEVWSDLHQDLVTDSHGSIKKVINVDAVATSIDNILNTNLLERCMLPQFGGSLRGILFDPIARSMASVIAKEIKRCIETWDNRVSVANIEIFEKPDDNRIDIEVAFTIAGYSESFTYTANVT